MMCPSDHELKLFCKYVYELCGIVLDESKGYLLESRLGPVLKAWQCATYNELYTKAKQDTSHAIASQIVDAISTNETSFFRDVSPFDLLKYKLVPEHFDAVKQSANHGRPPLRIWSAACATGQEVYSLAIALKELLGDLSAYHVNIVGTDISDTAIAQASSGRYNQVEMARGLSQHHARQYFDADGSCWRIKDELRALATFRKLNLLQSFRGVGKFDIILCRNVAIYFRPEDRTALFDRLAAQLNPHGVLLVGSTESLIGVSQRYEVNRYQNAVFYRVRRDSS